ncbi:MAG TPA: GntR family transcriptional regulator [Pseudolabrys sp.]|jgi:DNA-binding GntR family transcriptional regulator
MANGAIKTGKRNAGWPALAAASFAASRSEPKATPAIAVRLGPLQQPSAPLRNKIIAAIRTAIETGVLVPGQRLIEKDLCEQLAVSRTSLREALREVQAEGILEYNSSRSLSVSSISIDDARNIYRLRSVLEALAVEQFIEQASDAQIKALLEESERLKAAYRSGVLEEILVAKRSFYDRICSGAKNPIAFDMINRLVLRTSSLRKRSLVRKERHQQSIKEIETLMKAIQRRDIARARAAAIEHVNNSARSALQ